MTAPSEDAERWPDVIGRTDAIRVIVGLKLKLYLRRGVLQQALLIIGATLAGLISIGVAVAVVLSRSSADAPSMIGAGWTIAAIGWFLTAMIMGGESSLNPQPFTLLPIRVPDLLTGFLAAACIGIMTTAATVMMLATLAHAPSPAGFIVMAVAVLVLWATLVLLGRAGVAVSEYLQRKRRGRDVAMVITSVVGISLALFIQAAVVAAELITIERVDSFRQSARWTPFGWAPEALALTAAGDTALALAWLLPATAFPVALFQLWQRLTVSMLMVKAEQSATGSSTGLVPKRLRSLPDGVVLAAYSRALLQIRRDPRELIQMASIVPLLLFSSFPIADLASGGDDRLVLLSISWGAVTGMIATNMFGADSRNTGVDLLAAFDFRAVLVGKALARGTIIAPFLLLSTVALAAFTGGWQYAATALLLASSLAICSMGMGMYVSCRAGYPLPEGLGFNANNMGNSLLPAVMLVLMVFAVLAAMAPLVAPSILVALLWSVPLSVVIGLASVVYAVAIFWWCAKESARWVETHQPEFFAALSRPSK